MNIIKSSHLEDVIFKKYDKDDNKFVISGGVPLHKIINVMDEGEFNTKFENLTVPVGLYQKNYNNENLFKYNTMDNYETNVEKLGGDTSEESDEYIKQIEKEKFDCIFNNVCYGSQSKGNKTKKNKPNTKK